MRDIMLTLHFIGLAMGLGTSFAHSFLGHALSKLDRSDVVKFQHQIKGLSVMGSIGTILLLISGIYLIIPYWPMILSLPLLILKLFLFVILLILILLINLEALKNAKNATENNLKKTALLGKVTLLTAISIVIVAVNIFH